MIRYVPLILVLLLAGIGVLLCVTSSWVWLCLAIPFVGLTLLGLFDLFHPSNNLLRIYPLLAYGRFASQEIRPELHQYFVESDLDGMPFNRNSRQLVYDRSEGVHLERSFGTEIDVYQPGYEWVTHSINPLAANENQFRVRIGEGACQQPYDMSLFNISSMSFGSLSGNAVLALNGGAKLGGFAHATGEGGLSRYHLEPGGDLVWELGTAYFGCRDESGKFDPRQFAEKSRHPHVKCITIKLSQGAKPGLGGVMPAAKMTQEIAEVRGVAAHRKCVSPPGHSEFNSPQGLLDFVQRLRELCGAKPVGFKFCVGSRAEFLGICKAMLESQTLPDFIIVDGGEGGTGAAPLEFEDHVGYPLTEGLHFVHQALIACGLREKIRLGCSGKVYSAFEIARRLIQGADYCNAARAMMFSLGCIQAQRCETNRCPTGITTQDPMRTRGLRPEVKQHRVYHFQSATVLEFNRLLASMGLSSPEELKPTMLLRRINPTTVKSYAEIYYQAQQGELLTGEPTGFWREDWQKARSDRFVH